MIEKIGRISNPLTIIAIFAALAEVAGTWSFGLVDKSYQVSFLWFLMLFPVLLVVLFFITLNFNPKVLYGPGDFRDEQNFITTFSGGTQQGMVTISSESMAEAVKLPPSLPETESGQFGSKVVLDAANAAFRELWLLIRGDFNSSGLKTFGFGGPGEGFFLLQYDIYEEVAAEHMSTGDVILIEGKRQANGRALLRVIGEREAASEDPAIFAGQLRKIISRFLHNCVDKKRLAIYLSNKARQQE